MPETSPMPEAYSPFESLLAALVRGRVEFAVVGGVCIPYLSPADLILLKQDSWREKDKLDVEALRRILEAEAGP